MNTASTQGEFLRRRRYAPAFKTKILAACLQSDASIAQVALQHGLSTNLLQTWIHKAMRHSQLPAVPDLVPFSVPSVAVGSRVISQLFSKYLQPLVLPSLHRRDLLDWQPCRPLD